MPLATSMNSLMWSAISSFVVMLWYAFTVPSKSEINWSDEMDDSPQFKVRRHPGDFDKIVVNEVSISLAEARELIAKLDEAIDIQVRRERKAREMRCGEPVLFGSEFTGRLTIL